MKTVLELLQRSFHTLPAVSSLSDTNHRTRAEPNTRWRRYLSYDEVFRTELRELRQAGFPQKTFACQVRLIVMMSESEIVRKKGLIYPVLDAPLWSSLELGWKGLVVERYSAPPCEYPDLPIDHHVFEFASQQHVSLGERPDWRGRLVPYSKYPGIGNFHPTGLRPKLRSFTQTEVIVCGVDPEFVKEVSGELDSNPAAQLRGLRDIRDETITSFMTLFANAAKSGEPSNHLYADHLIYAFTLQLLSLGQDRPTRHIPKGALPPHRLRRVIERMRADLCTDLNLMTIAAESGYSRNHFLRMFKTATGCTPHQYLLQLRIEKAQSLMKDRFLRMIDIAEACGFTSQSQFSRVFRQMLGVTPRQYRCDTVGERYLYDIDL